MDLRGVFTSQGAAAVVVVALAAAVFLSGWSARQAVSEAEARTRTTLTRSDVEALGDRIDKLSDRLDQFNTRLSWLEGATNGATRGDK